jgi:hypothetical protein
MYKGSSSDVEEVKCIKAYIRRIEVCHSVIGQWCLAGPTSGQPRVSYISRAVRLGAKKQARLELGEGAIDDDVLSPFVFFYL